MQELQLVLARLSSNSQNADVKAQTINHSTDMLTRASVHREFESDSTDILLLQLLHALHVSTRAELEAITHLSPSTVSKVVRRLIDAGFAEEIGQIPSTGGRPSRQIRLRPQARFAIGAEFNIQRQRVVVTDLNGAIQRSYEADSPAVNADRITDALIDLIEQALDDTGREQVIGIGIAVPGVADTATGHMVVYSDLNLRDFPLGEKVQARTGFSPRIYNRSTSAAMGEKWQGDGRAAESLFYVALDAGISGGLILRGQSYQGASPAIAEIGHATVDPDGPLCFCGNQGCLQMIASSGALANRARELIKLGHTSNLSAQVEGHLELIDGVTVLQSANAGDELSLRILAEAADYVGIAVGNVINLFSPEMVVLGGGLVWSYPEPWVEMIRASIQRRTLGLMLQGTQIVVSQLRKDNRCIGAAALAVRHWLMAQSPPHSLDIAEVIRRNRTKRI